MSRSSHRNNSNAYEACEHLLNSVERYQPHLLIYFLRELAQKVHQFYNEVNVLKASPEEASTYMFVLLQAKQRY